MTKQKKKSKQKKKENNGDADALAKQIQQTTLDEARRGGAKPSEQKNSVGNSARRATMVWNGASIKEK